MYFINQQAVKNSVGGEPAYLNDLIRIIRVHEVTINSSIKHLETPPVLVDRLSLSLFSLLRQVGLTNPVKERHHPSFVVILLENSCAPTSRMTILTVSNSR